jgi:hypothetical protein
VDATDVSHYELIDGEAKSASCRKPLVLLNGPVPLNIHSIRASRAENPELASRVEAELSGTSSKRLADGQNLIGGEECQSLEHPKGDASDTTGGFHSQAAQDVDPALNSRDSRCYRSQEPGLRRSGHDDVGPQPEQQHHPADKRQEVTRWGWSSSHPELMNVCPRHGYGATADNDVHFPPRCGEMAGKALHEHE